MFETLTSIDWSEYHHAFGPATKTPDALRQLASPVHEEQLEAYDELEFTICHQGSIYPASLKAIPFLIELLDNDDLTNKDLPLKILNQLATGVGFHIAHRDFELTASVMNTPAYLSEMKKEECLVSDIKNKIRSHLECYLRLVTHRELETRMAATQLCAMFAEAENRIIPILVSAYEKESSTSARANLAQAIAILSQGTNNFLSEALATERALLPRLICFAASLSTKQTNETAVSLKKFKERLLECDQSVWDDYGRLPLSRDFILDLVIPLVVIEPDYQEELLSHCLALKPTIVCGTGARGLLLLALFPDGGLSDLKKNSLEAISHVARAAWPDAATNYCNMIDVLRQFELPARRMDMKRFLRKAYSKLGIELAPYRESCDETTGNPFLDTFFAYMEPHKTKPWWRFW